MASRRPYLSVVIPAYNETENFNRGCLDEVVDYLAKQKFSWEVIFVDDGSTDKSPGLLKNFVKEHSGFRYQLIPHGGKLAAVSAGIKEAKGEIVLFSDFDQSTPIWEFKKMIPRFNRGADMVIASRYEEGAERIDDNPMSLLRSQIFRWLVWVILFLDMSDSQCGFKAFKGKIGRRLFSALKVHRAERLKRAYMGSFDVELIYLAKKFGYKVLTIPVTWRLFKSKHLKWDEPLRMLLALLKIRYYDLIGRYDQKS